MVPCVFSVTYIVTLFLCEQLHISFSCSLFELLLFTGTGGSVQKGGGGEFESLSSESDWSISDDEPGSTKPGKNKKSTAALSDQ